MWVIRELVKEGILKNGRRSVPVYVENCLEKKDKQMERVKFIVF